MKAFLLTGVLWCVVLLNINAQASNTDSTQIEISVVVKQSPKNQRCQFDHLNESKIQLNPQISGNCDLKYAKILKSANQIASASSYKAKMMTVKVTVE